MRRTTASRMNDYLGGLKGIPAPWIYQSRSRVATYAIAVAIPLAAFLLARWLMGAPISIFMCAIALSVYVGGPGPGLLTAALSEVAFLLWLRSAGTQEPVEAGPWTRQLLFGLAALFLVYIGAAQRAATLALRNAVSDLRQLSDRIFHAQDDERRRIARMLHESTAQDLAVLKLHLARLDRTASVLTEDERVIVHESVGLADQSMTTIRTLSYLLYPPFLDESGLPAAIRWYVQGFTDRTGIPVDVLVPEGFARLERDVEATLFRVAQEALTNVHRHSHSTSAAIRLRGERAGVVLEVADAGDGMATDVRLALTKGGGTGVGIASMRERLQHLGGRLEIESTEGGTTIRAVVPVRDNLTA